MKKALFILATLACSCNSGEQITNSELMEPYYKILEYTPAPGQFINEPLSGFKDITTPAQACEYAEKRLDKALYISLGGWGGYLVASFGEAVERLKEGGEIYIAGNSMATSSEPGVVYVAQDTNGDGLANDQWYVLRGSEWERTKHSYTVTYTRPMADNIDIEWEDNQGETGVIKRIGQHTQPSYYPAWITSNKLAFSGIRLPDNIRQGTVEGSQAWIAQAFAWGYVDNHSLTDIKMGYNCLNIADAVTANGTPANLESINFVKIQTGVNASAPAIGEISTEVCAIACKRIRKS